MSFLLPTDGCERCITVDNSAVVHPYEVIVHEEYGSLRAWYCCPRCGYRWWTSWDKSATALLCLGRPHCPDCPPPDHTMPREDAA